MRLLLDTQIVLWQMEDRWRPPKEALAALDAAEEVTFSVVSFAEIGIKRAIGKLVVVPRHLRDHLVRNGLRILPLDPEHGLGVAKLPLHHRDPFDRLLISQALHERLTIITADKRFSAYDVRVIDT